jgi:hypothetical protein
MREVLPALLVAAARPARFPVPCWGRAVSLPVASSRVTARVMTSARMTPPRTSAVAAGITRVKLPAAGPPFFPSEPDWTSAAGLAIPLGTAEGLMTGTRLAMLPGLTRAVIAACGVGAAGGTGTTPVTGSVGRADGGTADGAAVLDGDAVLDGEGECDGAGPWLTVTDAAATGIVIIGGLVAALAVAVSVAAVPAGTAICARIWNDDGETSVASDPIVHEAAPSPLGHMALNVGCAVAGAAVRVTDTPEAEPFCAETVTA